MCPPSETFSRKTISYLFTKEEMNKIELREKAIELGLGIFFTGALPHKPPSPLTVLNNVSSSL